MVLRPTISNTSKPPPIKLANVLVAVAAAAPPLEVGDVNAEAADEDAADKAEEKAEKDGRWAEDLRLPKAAVAEDAAEEEVEKMPEVREDKAEEEEEPVREESPSSSSSSAFGMEVGQRESSGGSCPEDKGGMSTAG